MPLEYSRRIYGLENEYGVTCTLKGQRRLSPDEVSRYIFRRVVSWGRSSNVFLENGARLYLDVGSHPEYATPECDLIRDLVVHDKAGELILSKLVESAEDKLREEGIRGTIYLVKNNTDSAGNSYGCHENYLIKRTEDLNKYSEIIIPFLISRQIYSGAGKVINTAKGAVFTISQRAEHIWEGVSSATTRSRPIINTRDESHADAEKYRRLHVIVGDSNMSQFATFLKVGVMGLVLRVLEDRSQSFRDMTLDNPVRAIREISHDITLKKRVKLINSRELTALEIQNEYLDKVIKYADHNGLPEEEATILKLWMTTLRLLESDPMQLQDQVDWIAKYRLIEDYRTKKRISMSSPLVALIDIQYHDTNRDRGVFYKMERRGLVKTLVKFEEIESAIETPPSTTRALLRGNFVKQAKIKNRDFTVDWLHLKLNDQSQRTILLKDPFKSHDERVEKLIASL
jgi:proteasome accessory factor A